MDIHEYQAKQILSERGIPVPRGFPLFALSETGSIVSRLSGERLVVKAQIHSGGRGKAGGVKLVERAGVAGVVTEMLGSNLVTHQTGPKGQKVRRLYIEETSEIKQEYYLSFTVNRSTNSISIIASAEGGVEIEEVAKHSPEKIVKVDVDISTGIQGFHARRLAYGMDLDKLLIKKFMPIVAKLYDLFVALDANQIEINPLVETAQQDFVALDAKINFDDNALYRHEEILALRDQDEEDEDEAEAKSVGLSYIKMEGNIGCMVNGAGLAMATMDIIKHYGAEPANFLDVGGSADKDRVVSAFRIITRDSNVQAILINIFGGIVRCDMIAEGIVEAAKEVELNLPLIVRLAGTRNDIGKEILAKSGLNITSADDLEDAAKKAVNAIS
ncbi:succinate--CoA ligase [ADP-forming] subunit beta [Rickettsiales bacterium]|nr:succinate--CoA ligase [ADP-forming] subunit beta [Rickettsiales bacterium]